MKLLVIGDIHNRWQKAEKICEKFPNHKKIFIGDYFDDFGDDYRMDIDSRPGDGTRTHIEFPDLTSRL